MFELQKMSNAVRVLSADMIEKAKSGHPGMPLGMADVATVLWSKFLHFDPKNPQWPNRDRFILSNGHGSALLYSLMYLTGFEDITLDEIKNFRQLGSKTAGHPEKSLVNGIDFSTGPLGQGIAGGVGMALAERILNAQYGDDFINHKTYVFVGDGCLMEGISEEAIELAGHLKLNNLIVLWDDNQITIDGTTAVASSTDMKKRFEASNWKVLKCNGHDFASIETALEKAQQSSKPVLIDCETIIGYGTPTKAGTPKCHGSPLGLDELNGLKESINWTAEPFDIPTEILSQWRAAGAQWEGKRQQWEKRVEKTDIGSELLNRLNCHLPQNLEQILTAYKEELIKNKETIATRKASQNTLNILSEYIPCLIGGSADLAAASYTKTNNALPITADSYNGEYIHYGIREHVMGGIMNGLAAHGGFIPFAGTFLSFVDYMKPAIRLACLMDLHEIYVLTHDSIGVGEDGPTHQPIEQLVSLRATPNLMVFRPADSVETVDCYECALTFNQNPSAIICSRQNLPVLRKNGADNPVYKGGYVLRETVNRQLTLIATGSEVALAVKTADLLAEKGIQTAVVSMPCLELFEQQSADYRQTILGDVPRIVIEAGSSIGWDRYIGETGIILGIDHFGASAPGNQLFETYGFTPENIEKIALTLLNLK